MDLTPITRPSANFSSSDGERVGPGDHDRGTNAPSRAGDQEHPQAEECFRTIVEQSLVGIYLFQGDRFVYVNPRMAEIFGRTAEAMTSCSLYDLIAPEDHALARENVRRRIEGEVSNIRYQLRMLRRSGRVLQIEVHGSVLTSYAGRPGLIGTLLDLTEQQQAANKLADDHRLLRTLIDNLPGYIFVKDTAGRYLISNRAHTRLLGADAEAELIGKTVFDFFPRETAQAFDADDQALFRTSRPVIEREDRSETGGQTVWHSLTKVPLRNAQGEITGVIGIKHDITEQKRIEAALRQAEAKFHSIFEHAVDGIFQTTPAGEYLMANPAAARMLGYSSPEELIRDRTDIAQEGYVHPEQRKVFQRLIAAQGFVAGFEYQARRKDGSGVWISENARTVRDATGSILYYEGTMEDITRRKRAEEHLREQAALLDLSSDAILVRDLTHRVTYWSKGAECLYGWTAEEAVGNRVTDLYAPAVWEGREAARKLLLEQGAWQGEIQQRTRAGKELVVHSRWTLLRSAEGAPQAVLVINRDVTETKQLEAQFLRSQRMESIGALAGGIAHDLNNALAPIVMASEFLKMTCTDAEISRVLDTIHESAKRGAGMVKQILTFARGSVGERGEVQPKHLIHEMIGITRHTFSQAIQIHTDVAPKVWTLVGNPTQLHQILLNLCVNARDAMPQGGVLTLAADNVHLSGPDAGLTPGAKPGPYVMLSVTDTGTGMPPAVRARIFDAFFTTKAPDKGTGLGLSTVLSIVKDHGGFLTVDSELGQGSTFKIYLPAQKASAPPAIEAAPPPLPMGRGELILVVDDEAAIRSVAKQTLQMFGYRVMTANDGAQAVAVCAQNLGDLELMITDMAMPIMDGRATLHAIRVLAPQLKVVAASGSDSLADSPVMKELDVHAFLRKPFSADDLIRTVHTVLHSRATGSPPV